VTIRPVIKCLTHWCGRLFHNPHSIAHQAPSRTARRLICVIHPKSTIHSLVSDKHHCEVHIPELDYHWIVIVYPPLLEVRAVGPWQWCLDQTFVAVAQLLPLWQWYMIGVSTMVLTNCCYYAYLHINWHCIQHSEDYSTEHDTNNSPDDEQFYVVRWLPPPKFRIKPTFYGE
jgi:hypothetical protein